MVSPLSWLVLPGMAFVFHAVGSDYHWVWWTLGISYLLVHANNNGVADRHRMLERRKALRRARLNSTAAIGFLGVGISILFYNWFKNK